MGGGGLLNNGKDKKTLSLPLQSTRILGGGVEGGGKRHDWIKKEGEEVSTISLKTKEGDVVKGRGRISFPCEGKGNSTLVTSGEKKGGGNSLGKWNCSPSIQEEYSTSKMEKGVAPCMNLGEKENHKEENERDSNKQQKRRRAKRTSTRRGGRRGR